MLDQFEQVDVNNDGLLSLIETRVLFPGLTEETFRMLDGNGDDLLSEAELEAVVAPGGCFGPNGDFLDLVLIGFIAYLAYLWDKAHSMWLRLIGEDDAVDEE